MNPSPEQTEKLERLIHRTLRELPPRRAPGSLEGRVLAELERRAALPWWRQNFAHWPLAVRAGFVVVSAGLAKVVLMAAVWAMAGFDAAQFPNAFAPQLAWLQAALDLAGTAANAGGAIFRSLPPLWLYGGAAFFATLYAVLFGVGAAAYRTLRDYR